MQLCRQYSSALISTITKHCPLVDSLFSTAVDLMERFTSCFSGVTLTTWHVTADVSPGSHHTAQRTRNTAIDAASQRYKPFNDADTQL